MAQVRQDNVQIKLEIDGSQSRTELDNLTRKAQVLQDGLKGLKKGSEEYVAQSAELSQVRARMGELQDEIGLTGLSYTQLTTLSRQLGRELSNLVPATEAYVAKATELGKVQARMDELRAGIKAVAQQFGKVAEVDFAKLRDEVGLTGLTLHQLGSLVKQLNEELDELTPGTEAFVAKSKELNQAEARLADVREQAQGVGEALDHSGSGFIEFAKKAVAFTGIQLGIEAVVDSLRELAVESVHAAAEGSDSIADMEKSLNATTAEATALRQELGKLDTRTSQAKLEGIAVAAGQLGISKEGVVAFTQSVDQAVVALGDEFTGGVEEVTKSLGGLQKLFKQTQDVSPAEAITRIGSALNALGADGQATGPVIAEFTARIGQLGDLAPQISQTLGLGAAFQELGLSAEISSGGVTNLLSEAARNTAGFAKQLGLTQQQFQQLINTDPNEVLLRLAESLRGASNTDIIATLDGLNLKSQEVEKVVSLLANKTDLVRAKQALAAAEYSRGTGLLDEFAKKNSNTAAQVEKAEKSFAAFRQELGEVLIPVYLRVLHFTGMLATVLRELPAFVGENKTAFGLLATAVALFNAKSIIAQYNLLKEMALRKLVTLGILEMTIAEEEGAVATYSLASAQTALDAALSANPIGAVVAVVAALAFGLKYLYDNSETFRGSVLSLWAALKPLGQVFSDLAAQFAPVVEGFRQLFASLGGNGPALLSLIGQLVAVQLIVPLKLLVTQVQATVDGFKALWEAGKVVLNMLGGDFEVNYQVFDDLTNHLKSNALSIVSTLAGQDRALAEGADRQDAEAKRRYEQRNKDFLQKHGDFWKQAGQQRVQQQRAADTEVLKAREAEIRAALALVAAGSAKELRLKRALVVVRRDIDLLGEKKTEGDRKVIRAEAQRDLRQLQDDYDKKQREAAEKAAKEQADVQKKIADLRAAALPDEEARKMAQLTAAADREKALAKGTAEQIAEQQRLILDKLAVDMEAVQVEGARSRGQAEVEVEKLNNSLILNEFDRRDAEIDTAAKEAKLKLLGTEKDYAVKVKAIDDDRVRHHQENDDKRVAYHRQVLDTIAEWEEETTAASLAARRRKAGANAAEQKKIDADEEKNEQKKLDRQQEQALKALDIAHQLGLISDEDYEKAKLQLFELFISKKDELHAKFVQDQKDREKQAQVEGLQQMSQFLTGIGDIIQAFSQRDVQREAAERKRRLANLEAEYKAGRVSKEKYEAEKSNIETHYDEQTRAIKQKAAEREKAVNIAQSVIAGIIAVLQAGGPLTPTGAATAIAAALATAKIIATPIPEYEQGGVFSRAGRAVRQYARGGRHINPVAGVADVGQRHAGGGIRMVDGATGEHLGEWERGEAYMILSRQTYANNKHLVDELIDTSLYRGGAPVRQQPGYYEDGGTFTTRPAAAPTSAAGGQADNGELVQLLRETRDAIRALPSRQFVGWGREDTAELEQRLAEREADRKRGSIS